MKLRPTADPLSCLDLGDRDEGDWWEARPDFSDDNAAEESYWREVDA